MGNPSTRDEHVGGRGRATDTNLGDMMEDGRKEGRGRKDSSGRRERPRRDIQMGDVLTCSVDATIESSKRDGRQAGRVKPTMRATERTGERMWPSRTETRRAGRAQTSWTRRTSRAQTRKRGRTSRAHVLVEVSDWNSSVAEGDERSPIVSPPQTQSSGSDVVTPSIS